jgi:CrcB protein
MLAMLNLYLSLAFGGALGACMRYGVATWVVRTFPHSLSLGTLAVNIVGSFCIGIAFVLLHEKTHLPLSVKPFLVTGFLGAFTTFSTFSLETLNHLLDGQYLHALSYVLLSVVLCVFATFIGIALTRLL